MRRKLKHPYKCRYLIPFSDGEHYDCCIPLDKECPAAWESGDISCLGDESILWWRKVYEGDLGIMDVYWTGMGFDIPNDTYHRFAWDRFEYDCFLEQIWAIHEGLT